jgi:hypothetical protein
VLLPVLRTWHQVVTVIHLVLVIARKGNNDKTKTKTNERNTTIDTHCGPSTTAFIKMPISSRNTTKKGPTKGKGTTKSKSGKRIRKDSKKATQSRKRGATESDSDGEEESSSEDEPKAKNKSRKGVRAAKKSKRNDESDEEIVEEIDNVIPETPAPEVISDNEELDTNDREVSDSDIIKTGTKDSQVYRRTALTSINGRQSKKRNP